MALLERIEENVIKVPLTSTTKPEIIRELVTVLKDAGIVEDVDAIVEAVLSREVLCSTGLDRGIAVPHAKTTAVPDLTIAIGIAPEGVDFEALDGEESRIFFLILAPPDQSGPHVQALSEIAKATQSSVLIRMLTAARTPAEVVELFRE
ncbi:MAG: PTS sugar transporter subunit IIA [Spirochaetales bacterium]|nr:PTS sugar transporter subunit IIA [Spirochaetales bacterium]